MAFARVRIWLGVAVLIGAAVALVVLLVAGGDDNASRVTTPTVPTSSSLLPATTTSTSIVERGQGGIVAVTGTGQVVLLDADTGEQRFVLMDGIDVSDPSRTAVALSPAEGAAYVVRPAAEVAASEIVRVPVGRGEPPQVVATGLSPSVSPDGASLAYVQITGTGREVMPAVVVRDLAKGTELRFAPKVDRATFEVITDVAWSPSGNSLLVTAGKARTAVFTVDVAKASSLDDAKRLGPDPARTDLSWFAATPFGGALAVGERTGSGSAASYAVRSIDLAGSDTGALATGLRSFQRLDARTGGGVLLLVADTTAKGGSLLRFRPGAAPETIATGIVVAAW